MAKSPQCPGAFSRLKLHAPVVGWAGSGGGVSQWGDVKSKNSVMLSAAASRAVRFGTLKRTSINRRIEVKSRTRCETKFGFDQGDTTTKGTRMPVLLKSPG